MLRLMWCIVGLLAIVANIDGKSDCPDATLRKVQQVHFARCNEENDERIRVLNKKALPREELLTEMCCSLSDTLTCATDHLRSECGDEAANEFIASAVFQKDCSSWRYPDSISQCHPWYTKWWFITIVAIIAIVVVASLVFWGIRKRGC